MKLIDGVKVIGKFNDDRDKEYFYTTFKRDGHANFWAYPSGNNSTDMELLLYEDGCLIERVTNLGKDDRNVLVSKRKVRANKEYRLELRFISGPKEEYSIKVKNYPIKEGNKRKVDSENLDIYIGDNIRDAQRCLLLIGFKIGSVDGNWGRLSLAATKSFQQIKSLKVRNTKSLKSYIFLACVSQLIAFILMFKASKDTSNPLAIKSLIA